MFNYVKFCFRYSFFFYYYAQLLFNIVGEGGICINLFLLFSKNSKLNEINKLYIKLYRIIINE